MSRLSSAEDDDRLLADVVVAAAPPQPEPQRWLRPRGTTWSVLGYLRVVAQRLHHSRSLSVFYVCMIIINCVVLAWVRACAHCMAKQAQRPLTCATFADGAVPLRRVRLPRRALPPLATTLPAAPLTRCSPTAPPRACCSAWRCL